MHAEHEDHNKSPQLGNLQPATNSKRKKPAIAEKRKLPIR